MIKFPILNRSRVNIPNHANLVYDNGSIFKLYSYKQEQFSGPSKQYELGQIMDSAFAFVIYKGKVIYTCQEQAGNPKPFYGLPGGFIEWGEESLDGVKRETIEEVGMKSNNWFKLLEYNKSDKIANTEHVFIAYDCENIKKQNLDSGERIKIMSATPKHFVEKIMFHNDFREKWILQFFGNKFTPAMLIEMLQNKR